MRLPCIVQNNQVKPFFLLSCFQKARFEKGKELLEAEFRSLLTRHSKAVPPILILDAISVDEELEVQEEVVLEHLPEGVLRDIICIAGWLVENGRNQGAASWMRLMLCWLDTFLGGPILSPCGLFSYFITIESKCCIK